MADFINEKGKQLKTCNGCRAKASEKRASSLINDLTDDEKDVYEYIQSAMSKKDALDFVRKYKRNHCKPHSSLRKAELIALAESWGYKAPAARPKPKPKAAPKPKPAPKPKAKTKPTPKPKPKPRQAEEKEEKKEELTVNDAAAMVVEMYFRLNPFTARGADKQKARQYYTKARRIIMNNMERYGDDVQTVASNITPDMLM